MNDAHDETVAVGAARAGIHDVDPGKRAAAAAALAVAWIARVDGLPVTGDLLDELAQADTAYPGVADAFYHTVKFEIGGDDGALLRLWTLRVLHARRNRRHLATPVAGNHLEFHAHEMFDDNVPALKDLLSWGYVDVVELALDHLSIPPADAVALMTALYEQHGRAHWGTALALHFATLLKPVSDSWPAVTLGTAPAVMYVSDYGANRLWTATWVFPQPPVPPSALPIDDPATLIKTLIRAGVRIGDQEAPLDHAQIAHIALPQLVNGGTLRRTYAPRPDLILDVVGNRTAHTINAIRLIRARIPSAVPAEPQ